MRDGQFTQPVVTTDEERAAVARYLKALKDGEAFSSEDANIAKAILRRACALEEATR